MTIEHVAWQVPDPPALAAWYVEHLGFRVVRQMAEAPFTTFLATSDGKVMLEVYHNPIAPVPDYPDQHHLVLHIAFTVTDITGERDRLLAAGATIDTDLFSIPSGDQLVMLRDPWGIPLQLAQRATPLL